MKFHRFSVLNIAYVKVWLFFNYRDKKTLIDVNQRFKDIFETIENYLNPYRDKIHIETSQLICDAVNQLVSKWK